MKKKLLILLLTVVAALCCALCFAGCGGGNNSENGENTNIQPHTHNYAYACSQTEHWQICTGCEDEKEPSPHSIENGVCPVCGYVERCTQGLEFEFYTHLNGYVVLKGTATDSDIYIPSFYNDLPVISIGQEAFRGCTSLESVTIGNGVTSIGNYAFENCTSLESITIPDSVTSIGGWAFRGCTSLTSITIPDSVTSIGGYAFENCRSLKSITIGNGVTSIGGWAFRGCTSLTDITMPDSVTTIGREAFANTAYYNNENNWINNVLYIGNHLIEAKETLSDNYDIRQGTKTIGYGAFSYCRSLTSVTIPDGVTSIGEDAFGGCHRLTSINISDSVASIGDYVFNRIRDTAKNQKILLKQSLSRA